MFSTIKNFYFYKSPYNNISFINTWHFFPFSHSFSLEWCPCESLRDLKIIPLQSISAENKIFHIFYFNM